MINSQVNINGSHHTDVEKQIQDSTIYNLRFPLIVLVVLFHLHNPGESPESNYAIYNYLSLFIGADGIAKIAVPAFFLISGYLFFYNTISWDLNTFYMKIKRRYKTLFIPYILWNALPVICIILINIIKTTINGGGGREVSPMNYLIL